MLRRSKGWRDENIREGIVESLQGTAGNETNI